MRVIIAGSRTVNENDVLRAVHSCPWIGFASVVVSGTAKGADKYGEKWAKDNQIEINRYPADWKKHGRRAGPMRNRVMAENSEGLIAVWDGQSRGTHSMIELAEKRGLRIAVFRTDTAALKEIQPSKDIAEIWEYAEERAAIFEHDGGLPVMEAERKAGSEALRQRFLKPTKLFSDIPEFKTGDKLTPDMFNIIVGILEYVAAKHRAPIPPQKNILPMQS